MVAHANGGRVNPLATGSVTFSVSRGVDVTPFREAKVSRRGECNGVTYARTISYRFILLPPAPANR